jgi:hypothetical protein
MASETVPAAAPGPNDPAPTAPAPTGLAGFLAPIQPARPVAAAFNLDPAATGVAGQETAGSGASSAAYHTPDNSPQSPSAGRNSGGSTGSKEGVFKTILRAAAERWRRGADIHVKRLEMQKARYQAAQVKETRQVVVNRSPGSTSGGGSGSGAGGKQTGSKTNSSGSGLGQKNSSGSGRPGSGSGNGGGRGTGSGGNGSTNSADGSGSKGGGADGRGSSGAGKTPGQGSGGANSGAKKPNIGTGTGAGAGGKDSGTGGRSGSGGSGKDSKGASSGNTGSAGGRGSDGKQGKDGQPGKATNSSSGKTAADDPRNDRPWKDRTGPGKTTDDKPADGNAKNGGTKSTTDTPKTTTGTDPKPAEGTGPKTPADTRKPVDLSKKPGTTPDTTSTGKTSQDHKKPSTPTTPDSPTKPTAAPRPGNGDSGDNGAGKPLDVQASREAGYRDGTRAGRVVAHAGAYRDGVRDGYRDTQQAADRQRGRLDKAHNDRKQQRHDQTKGADVTAKTSADHHPRPVPVQEVTATHVTFGGGQTRTRGEVRTLKQYERRLEEKALGMHRIADATKKLQAHAEDQAKEATKLLEQAKAIKGGEKVTAILGRLVEKATNQARLAQALNQRAARAAENTTVVLANTQTRYGPIYKAVVDSPETKPAELRFYRDGGTSNG